MRIVALTLASLLVFAAGDAALARDRDDNRGNGQRAMYSEQGRSVSNSNSGRQQREERRDDHRGRDNDRREWRDPVHRDNVRNDSDRHDNDRHRSHSHRDRDWNDRNDWNRRDWRDSDWHDRNHRHYRDYSHHDHYYYSPAPRRVIYLSDGYGHYRHYHLRHDYYSHFYDPFYFHNGVHIHAGCHYHHFGDAIAAGIVIGAILGDW